MKKTLSLIVVIVAVTMIFTGCSNAYKKGVDYDDFPDREIPVYDDAVVYSYEEDRDEWEIEFGTKDGLDDLDEFYVDEFSSDEYVITKLELNKDEFICEGYHIEDELYFEIEAEEAEDKAKDYFDYVVKIEVEEKDVPKTESVESALENALSDTSDDADSDNDDKDDKDDNNITNQSSYNPTKIDGNDYELDYLTITILDGWETMDVQDGLQAYKDSNVLQISVSGTGLNDEYALTFVENMLSATATGEVEEVNMWGIDFYSAEYEVSSYNQIVRAAVIDGGRLLMVNVGYMDDKMPEDIQSMLDSVELK